MKMRTKFLLAILSLFLGLPGPGAGLRAAPHAVHTAGPLRLRYPDPARLQSLQADERFRYRPVGQPALTFWDRLKGQLMQVLHKLFYNQKSGAYGRYALYALGIGIMGWVILQLLGAPLGSLFGRPAAAMSIPYETYPETIHGIDFPALIAQAEAQGDYRRAIRLYYLSILKALTDQALIAWSPGKTNRSYVPEILNASLRRAFENLTRQFEIVWYGGSPLSKPVFQQVRLSFEAFNNLLKTKA